MSISTSHKRGPGQVRTRDGGGDFGGDGSGGGGGGGGGGGPMVKVAFGRSQTEAEMIQGLLMEAGIPSMLKRTIGFDVPDFLAAGPRDVLVNSDRAREARTLLAETLMESDPEEADPRVEAGLPGRREGVGPAQLAFGVAAAFVGALALVWILYQLS